MPLQDDPNDVKFTMLLMQNLDPEERDALVPMSVLDGEGGTTLRKVRECSFDLNTVPAVFYIKFHG